MKDIIHAKLILIYVVRGSGCGQRNLYTLNPSLHTHTAEQAGAFCLALLPAHPASAYRGDYFYLQGLSYFQEVPVHRNHGSRHSTRQMEGKLVWGGLTVPARLHPLHHRLCWTGTWWKVVLGQKHVQRKAKELGKGLEQELYDEQLRELGVRSLEKKEVQGRSYFSLQLLKRSL